MVGLLGNLLGGGVLYDGVMIDRHDWEGLF